jgi:hypothetical protein
VEVEALPNVCSVAVAAVLLAAAVGKLVAFAQFQTTLRSIGVALTGPIASALIFTEMVAAVGISVTPQSTWPVLVTLFLFTLFAAVGVWVARRQESIDCKCFGVMDPSTLGYRQAIQFAAVVPTALVASRASDSLRTGLVRFDVAAGLALIAWAVAIGRIFPRLYFDRVGKGLLWK